MATVFIPTAMRPLTGDIDQVTVVAKNVRQVIAQLEERFPGAAEWLCDQQQLRPGISVSVGGSVATMGLLQPVAEHDEVHFLPAFGGG